MVEIIRVWVKKKKTGGANFPTVMNTGTVKHPRHSVSKTFGDPIDPIPRILQPSHIQVHETAVVNVVGLKGFPDVEEMGAPWLIGSLDSHGYMGVSINGGPPKWVAYTRKSY